MKSFSSTEKRKRRKEGGREKREEGKNGGRRGRKMEGRKERRQKKECKCVFRLKKRMSTYPTPTLQ